MTCGKILISTARKRNKTVPKWSKPDYVNQRDVEEKAESKQSRKCLQNWRSGEKIHPPSNGWFCTRAISPDTSQRQTRWLHFVRLIAFDLSPQASQRGICTTFLPLSLKGSSYSFLHSTYSKQYCLVPECSFYCGSLLRPQLYLR